MLHPKLRYLTMPSRIQDFAFNNVSVLYPRTDNLSYHVRYARETRKMDGTGSSSCRWTRPPKSCLSWYRNLRAF